MVGEKNVCVINLDKVKMMCEKTYLEGKRRGKGKSVAVIIITCCLPWRQSIVYKTETCLKEIHNIPPS